MSMGPVSIPPAASHAGAIRCAVTPDASPSATITATKDVVGIFEWTDPVTIKAGQAVAFVNPNGSPHTVTEGSNGVAVADPCVDAPLSSNKTVLVTFYLPGTYQITCRPHAPMQTSVIVQ